MNKSLASLAAVAAVASAASGAIVQVDIVGSVDFNSIHSGQFGNIPSGTPARMTFNVDSNTYSDSPLYPTRGYNIDPASFTLMIGASSTAMLSPYPAGETPYFILRNNDPGVDGFLLGPDPSSGDPDHGVWTTSPAALDPTFRANFLATYGASTLSSLDILGAQGTYTFAGLTVFNWGLVDGPFQPMGLIFDYFTISTVPAPGAAGLLMLAPLGACRRRRSVR